MPNVTGGGAQCYRNLPRRLTRGMQEISTGPEFIPVSIAIFFNDHTVKFAINFRGDGSKDCHSRPLVGREIGDMRATKRRFVANFCSFIWFLSSRGLSTPAI
jgi:hypothetical protein